MFDYIVGTYLSITTVHEAMPSIHSNTEVGTVCTSCHVIYWNYKCYIYVYTDTIDIGKQ